MFYHLYMLINQPSRRDRNNRIINSIMSGQTPVFLLCPTEPSYLDFLPDLTNNYHTVYTYSAAWNTQVDFLLYFAKTVLSEEEYAVAEAYVNCRQDGYERMLLKKILLKIFLVHNDCLFFLTALEKLDPSFDFSIFEYLMAECPDNLKLVFCSTAVPHIFYGMNDRAFPRIIVCDRPGEELPFSESVFTEDFFDESRLHVLKELSVCPYVDNNFAERLFPGSSLLLAALARNYRSVILKAGDFYSFHPLARAALEKVCDKPCRSFSELTQKYVSFYFENGQYRSALEKAIEFNKPDMVEKTVAVLFEKGQEDFVCRLFMRYKLSLPDLPICNAFTKAAAGDFRGALEASKKTERESVRKKAYYMLSFYLPDVRKEAFNRFCNELDKEPELLFSCVGFIGYLTYSEKKTLGVLPGFIKTTERIFEEGTKDIVFLHYVSKIYAAIGNYVEAKKFLLRIKELCDYYRYSYAQSWSFFFNMPIDIVASYAKETSNTLLECCGYLYEGNKAQVLSCLKKIENKDVYNPEGMLGLALQSLFYAEAGDPDFGRSLALLYAVLCEREDREESSLLFTSIAYCEWMLRNNNRAIAILQKVQKTNTDAFFSFLTAALEIACTLDAEPYSVVEKRLEKLLSVAEKREYDNAIVVLRTLFTPLISFAERNGICSDYSSKMSLLLVRNKEATVGRKNIQVKYFGSSAVYMDKREIFWKTRKCKELFLLYSFYPDGIERNKIISEIWSDYVYASAINNLKTTNNLIRKTLKEYGIPFEFTYANGKYRLTTERCESDIESYRLLQKEYAEADDLRKKAILASRMLSLTDEGLALDCELPSLKQEDRRIKEEQSLMLTGLIREMIRLNDYLNAKRFLLRLEKIGLFDCEKLKTEIDKLV